MTILVTSIVNPRQLVHSRLHEYIRILSEKDTVLVAWPGSGVENASDLPSDGGLHAGFASPRGIVLDEVLSTTSLWRKLLQRDFALILNYNALATGSVASVLGRLRDAPIIYDLADDLARLASHYLSDAGMALLRGPLASIIAWNLRMADRVAYTTETLATMYGLSRPKSVCLPNGVDVERFRNLPRISRPNSETRLLFLGGLREWVDFSPVLGAMKVLRRRGSTCRLRVVGSGPGESRLKALASSLGVSDEVDLSGPVHYDRVPEVLRDADICLLPFNASSVSCAALPLKLLEYMAARRPVIATPLPEIVRVAGNLIWYAKTLPEYASAIDQINGHRDLEGRLDQGLQWVSENFSWRNFQTRLEAIVQDVAG